MHKRSEIKDKIVEMLKASGNSFENIYKARYLPLTNDKFPAASVYCPEDSSELAKSQEHYNRTAKAIIMVYCQGYDDSEVGENSDQRDIDTELDDLTAEVEGIFFAPIQTLEKTVYRMYLTNTKYMVKPESEDIIGVATMEFNVEYQDLLL